MNFEFFPALSGLDFIHHAFTTRTPADTRTADYESRVVQELGYPGCARADQPHGANVARVNEPSAVLGTDALITNVRRLPLLVRCADCAAVFIVDRQTPAIALIHSGKMGTLANITGNAVAALTEHFRTNPRDCLAVISPSIGPCHYEMDLWGTLEAQLRAAGVADIQNSQTCTACHLDRYFSYRAELGQTGRMFALLAIR